MALVNVAVDLVKMGRRVLIVDFDLEAPGLDTFNLPRPPAPPKGVVEFVLEYLETGESADLSQFVYKSAIPNAPGELWVMPAGKPDREYDSRFKSIDWRDLYEHRDGFVLFEDLKAQWNQVCQPDYVLIDSRTGHTDVGGVCTRQLPDAVALFCFPNEQNRRGLETVLEQIRAESATDRKKNIKLHFVMSNVPELDDEEGLLAGIVAKLKSALGFKSFSAVIHHYESLTLLTQSVFTQDRPRTRLAQEYRNLARAIRRENLDDREAALEFLDEVAPRARWRSFQAGDIEQRIQDIRSKHSGDAEVLVRLSVLLRSQRRFAEALTLLEQAGELGANNAEFLHARAELHFINHNRDGAIRDVTKLLEHPDATYLEVGAAARLLEQLEPESINQLVQAPAFIKLDSDGKYYVAEELMDTHDALPVVTAILREVVKQPEIEPQLKERAQSNLELALIGLGQFDAAIDLINPSRGDLSAELKIDEVFNYAMAQWGLTLNPTPDLFRKVVELDQRDRRDDANHHQCLAIALWAVRESDKALERLGEASQKIMTSPGPEFSAWSYLRVTAKSFLRDLKEIQHLIEGESVVPRFIRINRSTQGAAE
jgi:tetratricopeptide (TPR) repeat protein